VFVFLFLCDYRTEVAAISWISDWGYLQVLGVISNCYDCSQFLVRWASLMCLLISTNQEGLPVHRNLMHYKELSITCLTQQPTWYNHVKTSYKLNMKKNLQNNWPMLYKSINVMKIKGINRNCPKLKETKETLCHGTQWMK
jgi:hypothetical protein